MVAVLLAGGCLDRNPLFIDTMGGPGPMPGETGQDSSGASEPPGPPTGASEEGSTVATFDPSNVSTDESSTEAPTTATTELSTSGDTSTGEPLLCLQQTLKPAAPNVMLVLDKSGSMVANPGGYWDHDDDVNTPPVTRWNSLHAVVESTLAFSQEAINFGVSLFPSTAAQNSYDPQACIVNVIPEAKVKPLNMDAILDAIPPANDDTLQGATPTAAAVTTARTHLKSLDPKVPRAIVLATDGGANCAAGAMNNDQLLETYDQDLHMIVADAWNVDEIPTYVVGLSIADILSPMAKDGAPDNINPTIKLNDLALKGGRPRDDPNEKFYNVADEFELQDAFDTVLLDALPCVIPLPQPPIEPALTEVEIDGVSLDPVVDCPNESGWAYTNPDGPYDAIVLCGEACLDLKLLGEADVNYYCA